MGLETGTYISDLNSTNPTGSDAKSQGDDHLRLIKAVLKATFPNANGAITPTVAEMNYLAGVTSAIQAQIDAKAPLSSPAFTGTPSLPTGTTGVTQAAGDNSTKLATTAYADAAALFSGSEAQVTAAAADLIPIQDASDANNPKRVTAQSIADLASGKIGQVVSNTFSTASSTNSTTLVDIASSSLSITPSSTGSKILILGHVTCGVSNTSNIVYIGLKRDSTDIGLGSATGSRTAVHSATKNPGTGGLEPVPLNYLDSPATTSSVTYTITYAARSGYITYVNRTGADGNFQYTGRPVSTLTLIEVLP